MHRDEAEAFAAPASPVRRQVLEFLLERSPQPVTGTIDAGFCRPPSSRGSASRWWSTSS
ncbi:hypothetical protein ACIBHX_48955 [Nonomuraea sp. NPDC050536]|uniref:hypothetical protein n=1 Tax=Nonomuraea sp. NPDC050536 TaxID=3364366 RepID=UPI0037CBC770